MNSNEISKSKYVCAMKVTEDTNKFNQMNINIKKYQIKPQQHLLPL